MKKKLNKKAIRIIIILTVLFLVFNVLRQNRTNEVEVKVRDYMPNKPMVKIFSDDMGSGGTVEVIDKVRGEFYEKKIIEPTTSSVSVYHITEKDYKLVYRNTKDIDLKKDYTDEKSNIDLILLREPLKKGVSWINPDESTYKIISTEETVNIMGKDMKVIKLRYRKNTSEYDIYFAEKLGIVRIDSEMGTSELEAVKYDVDSYLNKSEKAN